jgi:hypothetical protein
MHPFCRVKPYRQPSARRTLKGQSNEGCAMTNHRPNEQSEPIMDGAMDHETSLSDAYTDGMTMAEADDEYARQKQGEKDDAAAEKDDADSPDELEQADETIRMEELP